MHRDRREISDARGISGALENFGLRDSATRYTTDLTYTPLFRKLANTTKTALSVFAIETKANEASIGNDFEVESYGQMTYHSDSKTRAYFSMTRTRDGVKNFPAGFVQLQNSFTEIFGKFLATSDNCCLKFWEIGRKFGENLEERWLNYEWNLEKFLFTGIKIKSFSNFPHMSVKFRYISPLRIST